LQSGHTTAGTFGKYLDAQISTINSGSSAVTDWTSSEREQIRDALGIDGSKTTATGGQLQDLITAASSVGSWTVVTPVSDTGDFTVYLGYDYTNAVNRALDFSSDTWTNLASATVSLVDRSESVVKAGSVVTSGTGVTQTVRIELTQSDLDSLGRGQHKLRLKAVIGSLDYILLDIIGTVL